MIKSGQTKEWFGELDEESAWNKLNEKFSPICNHLFRYKDKAQKRYDQGNYWWELRACDYYEGFEKQKIVWPETSFDNQYCYIEKGIYLNKTTFMIPLVDHSLLALLNSKLATFFFGSIVSKMRGGYFSMSKAYVETFRVVLNNEMSSCLNELVNQILDLKRQSYDNNIITLEKEIDQLVYKLYDLTEEEIKIIEESV